MKIAGIILLVLGILSTLGAIIGASFSGPIGPPNIFQPTYILNLQHYPNKVKKYKYF